MPGAAIDVTAPEAAPASAVDAQSGPATNPTADMFEFLKDVLNKLETAQGCIDEEARAGLELLKRKTQELEEAKAHSTKALEQAQGYRPAPVGIAAVDLGSGVVPSNVDLAHKLDKLQGDLNNLELKLESMDETTKALVSHSTVLWLGGEEQQRQQPPAVPAPETPKE